jgi:hypothetical protein
MGEAFRSTGHYPVNPRSILRTGEQAQKNQVKIFIENQHIMRLRYKISLYLLGLDFAQSYLCDPQ